MMTSMSLARPEQYSTYSSRPRRRRSGPDTAHVVQAMRLFSTPVDNLLGGNFPDDELAVLWKPEYLDIRLEPPD
jgi:hypothetical protein